MPDHPAPVASFLSFLQGLKAQALMQFGDIPNPISGGRDRNLPYARYTIDLLEILERKTRGNRDGEEDRFLTTLIADCRTRLAQVAADG